MFLIFKEKRSAFPRFYFIGDDDLLEILGQSTNPSVIQSHLKKLFAGKIQHLFSRCLWRFSYHDIRLLLLLLLSHLSHVRLCATPSLGFSIQEHWSGLPFPSPGDLPTQGSNPGLLHCWWILYQLSHKGNPI